MSMRILCLSVLLVACASCTKIGSPEWCADMDEKSKGDWTANEAGDYAKYCVLGIDPDEEQDE